MMDPLEDMENEIQRKRRIFYDLTDKGCGKLKLGMRLGYDYV